MAEPRSPTLQRALLEVVHNQLRELYSTYGFVPHCGAQSFLVPLASQHLPAFDSRGARLRDEVRQKMLAQADRFDPDEAGWIARRVGIRTKALGTLSDAQARPLTKQLGVLDDPSVLVFRRPDELVIRLTGFADKQTVEQAARNAAL